MLNNTLLKVSGIPPSLNKMLNMHWAVRNKEKKDWYNKILFEINHLKLKKILKKDIIITITYYFKTKAKHDWDNYYSKFLIDGLKGNLIIDDSQDYIKELRLKFGLAGIGVEPYTTIELSYDDSEPNIIEQSTNNTNKKLTLKKLDKVIEQSQNRTRCDICGKPNDKLIKGIDQVSKKIILFCGKCMLG